MDYSCIVMQPDRKTLWRYWWWDKRAELAWGDQLNSNQCFPRSAWSSIVCSLVYIWISEGSSKAAAPSLLWGVPHLIIASRLDSLHMPVLRSLQLQPFLPQVTSDSTSFAGVRVHFAKDQASCSSKTKMKIQSKIDLNHTCLTHK